MRTIETTAIVAENGPLVAKHLLETLLQFPTGGKQIQDAGAPASAPAHAQRDRCRPLCRARDRAPAFIALKNARIQKHRNRALVC
jgi:hypothetical protein